MIFRVQSKKNISDVARDLETASKKNGFGVLMVHDLKAKMKEKGVDFASDCLIFEVCNPHQARKVLEANPEMSTALPCRISVYPEGDVVTLATIKPTAMVEMFEEAGLQSLALEVERVLFKIMQEAAR